MKKPLLMLCAFFTASLLLSESIFAEGLLRKYELSPALEIIGEKLEVKKCTVQNRDVVFTRFDFEETLGKTIEYITISSLPDTACGVLKYAGNDVFESQSVSARNISLLKFVPARNSLGTARFEFCADGESPENSSLCTINVLSQVNLAPEVNDKSYTALSGIDLIKTFGVSDPEKDSFSIEITQHPENGILKVSGEGFSYRCSSAFSGKDSFSYRAIDKYGNKSEEATAYISVREPQTDIRYTDMQGHWGYTSAVTMTELGLMGERQKDGKSVFCPDEPISRGDFLAMAMIIAGLEEKVSLGSRTAFSDDAGIPANIRSYAAYAAASGIISGYTDSRGSAVFDSENTINRAEAASVLSKILNTETAVCNYDYSDAASVPSWAKSGLYSLVNLGIINGMPDGTLSVEKEMTRAEAAQILCATKEYLEEKENEESEKKSFWQKLFGK